MTRTAIDQELHSGNVGPLSLETQGLTVRFGGVVANADIDLQVESGAIVAVVGPNGAGKTTILNAICGLVPSTGIVRLGGQPLQDLRPHELVTRGLGRSFQHPHMITSDNVLENVMAGAIATSSYTLTHQILNRRRVARQEEEVGRRAMALLERVGLADMASESVMSLPYGPSKIVDILRALIAGPRMLLLDEPTSGLDHRERAVVASLIRDINDSDHTTMVLVEHHMELVREVAHRVVALQSGKVLMEGGPEELFESPEFQDAMLGRVAASRPDAHGTESNVRTP